MRLMIRIALLLFVLANTSYAQGRLDFTYGKSTESLGMSFWQTMYLGNNVGLEYTRKMDNRWSVSSGLRFSGFYFNEQRRLEANTGFRIFCGCCGVCILPDIKDPFNMTYDRYSAGRLEMPLMINYKIGKHEKLPFAIRTGFTGLANRVYTHQLYSGEIEDKSMTFRMQMNLGLQIPLFRTRKMGIFLEPYGNLGREPIDPNRMTLDFPRPEVLFDYGIKLGVSLY